MDNEPRASARADPQSGKNAARSERLRGLKPAAPCFVRYSRINEIKGPNAVLILRFYFLVSARLGGKSPRQRVLTRVDRR